MAPVAVFAVQLAWFAAVWAVLARLVVWPWSQRLAVRDAVSVWVAPQMFRILGLGLLVPKLAPGMPAAFAISTAVGDALTAVLALAAFVALRRGSGWGIALAWACTVVGATDLVIALAQAARSAAAEHLAGQWYVAALVVPLMAVSHVGCAATLLRGRDPQRPA